MRATAAIMTVVMYFTPAMLLADQAAHAAPPIVDPRAPVQFQPTITQTGAGVPAVNITAPNAAGLSVNQYSSFGVDAGTGLVLNNSLVSGTPLLGGALGANPNLAGRTATTILNQVTSTAPAILAGPLEVFGSPASVIVAAPNGVSVSGLSLTNAPGLVLTTGVPQFITGPGGAATSFANAFAVAFAVSSGNVSINGAPGSTGANGPGAGIEGTVGNIDLIGQSVSLNAPLYANQAVHVITGNQTVTPTSGSTGAAYGTSNVAAGQPGAVAVDASAFGSITAGQVFIVSTAAGQGRQPARCARRDGGQRQRQLGWRYRRRQDLRQRERHAGERRECLDQRHGPREPELHRHRDGRYQGERQRGGGEGRFADGGPRPRRRCGCGQRSGESRRG